MSRAAVLGLCGALIAQGCLPRQALTRHAEVESDRYALDLTVDVTTDGADLAPFVWHVTGTVAWSWTRGFRDGSMGHLVQFEDLEATLARGDVVVPVAAPLSGVAVELRTFPDGEVLAAAGASRAAGAAGHLELLDVLWPALSPHLPANRKEASAPFATSWTASADGGPTVRTRALLRWEAAGEVWSYAGDLEGAGGPVALVGESHGTVTLGDVQTRVLAHHFESTRAVTTRWSGQGAVEQHIRIVGDLRHAGTGPPVALARAPTADDPRADARPITLADGTVVANTPSAAAIELPFLLVPDDLDDDARARLLASLRGTGSMAP